LIDNTKESDFFLHGGVYDITHHKVKMLTQVVVDTVSFAFSTAIYATMNHGKEAWDIIYIAQQAQRGI